jgi:hypothetical protein
MWKGPYHVSEVKGRLMITIQHINNPQDQQVISVHRVKPCLLDESLPDFTQRILESGDRLAHDLVCWMDLAAIPVATH